MADKLNKGTKILIWVMLILIIASIWLVYQKSFIDNDFTVEPVEEEF